MKAGWVVAVLVSFTSFAAAGDAGHKAVVSDSTHPSVPEPVGDPPAGAYTLDKAHTSLIFRVSHMGFSRFTARFARYDVQLQFDPAHLTHSQVNVTIDPRSIETDNPPPGFIDMLRGAQWLDTEQYPQITFRSTKIAPNGSQSFRIEGELGLHGVSHPVVLEATFNGGYAGHPMDPHARIGFSAHGTFQRSAFGMGFGVPAAGSRMGVGDDVEVAIETELSGPAWAQGAPAKS